MDVACDDTGKQHEGDTKGDAEDFDFAKIYTDGDDDGIEQHHMSHRVGVGEKIDEPVHDE